MAILRKAGLFKIKTWETVLWILLFLLSANPLLAEDSGFEFKGIKSGMRTSEIIDYLELDKKSMVKSYRDKYPVLYRSDKFAQYTNEKLSEGAQRRMKETDEDIIQKIFSNKKVTIKNDPKGSFDRVVDSKKMANQLFVRLNFYFTDQGKLYGLDVLYLMESHPLRATALKEVLEKRYGKELIRQDSIRALGKGFIVEFRDAVLAMEAIDRHKDEYEKKLNVNPE